MNMRNYLGVVAVSVLAIMSTAAIAGTTIQLSATDDVHLTYWWDWPAVNAVKGANPTSATMTSYYYHNQGYRTNYQFCLAKFDLSSVPDDFVVESAALKLFVKDGDSCPDVYWREDDWSESAISYDGAPASNGLIVNRVEWTQTLTDQWVSLPIDLSLWTYATDLADNALSVSLNPVGSYGGNTAEFATKEYPGGEYAAVLEISGVPEPTTLGLLLTGGIGLVRRRR